MNTPRTALQGQNTTITGWLYMAFELGEKGWKLSLGDGVHGPSRHTLVAGDLHAVLEVIAKAKARCGLASQAPVRSCYEAGRDGFWLHRWLTEQGILNLVVDSSSIEVNRRARRAKTDRLDGDKLLSMLMRYHAGERRVWTVARVPTPEQEDERRLHRELGRLKQERTSHSNRIRSLLVLHNLRVTRIGDRSWNHWWNAHGSQLPAGLGAEIEREVARLALVVTQIKAIESQQHKAVKAGTQPAIAQLARLGGIGVGSAWLLIKELFGWRRFHNRREVAGCLGLAPTPYSSGETQVEQGISKAGNKRSRWLMIELAWSWLRYQPTSQLTQWFNERFAPGSKRMRRVGIVALARRLAIALWRYLDYGEIPPGASLKPAVR
ncbi:MULTISPECIES: IS110 family transposase [Burkholderiaceae]|jgi:transposase|uniref:IS110 family transposase n=2 Tax=Ralstonia pickettii TaxID=329 RepID=A0AAW4QEI4_RALPI|nr:MULTISPECIES: IS110 family transposase [Burkholderiaceae]MBA9848704.1 IS110 family transposase [Ralstonia pickettii]MBA9854131.1 IS110 family transposase [Ralstonia pickettii]MBA9921749.1 IS110 family transposase [Ralstonia pickettii]MBA9960845.1 IS110 family transposase [Ralstonia pickettii]MBA9985091.1 IS110 family transposase [Ralstonia pickettii]